MEQPKNQKLPKREAWPQPSCFEQTSASPLMPFTPFYEVTRADFKTGKINKWSRCEGIHLAGYESSSVGQESKTFMHFNVSKA